MRNKLNSRQTIAAAMVLTLPSVSQAATSYYDQYGGHAGITALVDTFVGNVAADPRINFYFAHTSIPHLKYELVNQIGQAEGGPEVYTGRDMVSAHKNLEITQAAFNALAEDLIRALDARHIPIAAQNDLLAKFASLEPQVVTK